MRPAINHFVELIPAEPLEVKPQLIEPSVETRQRHRIPSVGPTLEGEDDTTSAFICIQFEAGDATEIDHSRRLAFVDASFETRIAQRRMHLVGSARAGLEPQTV